MSYKDFVFHSNFNKKSLQSLKQLVISDLYFLKITCFLQRVQVAKEV